MARHLRSLRTLSWRHWSAFIVLVVLNIMIVSDYFYHGSKPANFDAIAHITTIAQFHKALSDGEFPVGWGDGFANYGLPLGTIAHQLPAYVGGLLTFVTHDPLLSFHIVYLITAVASALLLYVFLTRFVQAESALLGTIFYSLAPYRIMNLYMRGAMPEFASALWVPLFLIIAHVLHQRKRPHLLWYMFLSLVTAGLILTHPMMLVVYAPSVGIWFLLCIRADIRTWAKIILAGLFALALTAYYFLPLNIETKYLYYGSMQSQYARNQTTTLDTFFNPVWRYNCVYRNDIFGRCQLTKGGLTETIILIAFVAIIALAYTHVRKQSHVMGRFLSRIRHWLRDRNLEMLSVFVILGSITSVILSTSALEPLYERIRIMGNIQYPWRFLSSYLFFPPLALAIIFEYIRTSRFSTLIWYALIISIVCLRFPQLYAKNYTQVPIDSYYFTTYNLHSLVMNTIWSGDSRDYPVKRNKGEIIEGRGRITYRKVSNASRLYTVQADTAVRMSDNTFYFPGWQVLIDGKETSIEFQDPYFRGVITFAVPPGEHTVTVTYTDTKVRMVGKIISAGALGILALGIMVLIRKR